MSQQKRQAVPRAEQQQPVASYPVIRSRLELDDYIKDLRAAATQSEYSGGQHSATLVTKSGSQTVEIHLPAKASLHMQ